MLVVVVTGELDAVTAPQLTDDVARGMGGEATAVVVDLSALQFLASAGMAVLLTGARLAASDAKGFAVVADGPATSRPLKTMGLDGEVNLHSTLDAALKSL